MHKLIAAIASVALIFAFAAMPSQAGDTWSYPVMSNLPPFVEEQERTAQTYTSLDAAEVDQAVAYLPLDAEHGRCLVRCHQLWGGNGGKAYRGQIDRLLGRRVRQFGQADQPARGLRGSGGRCIAGLCDLAHRPQRSDQRGGQKGNCYSRLRRRHPITRHPGTIHGAVLRWRHSLGEVPDRAAPEGFGQNSGLVAAGTGRGVLGGGLQQRLSRYLEGGPSPTSRSSPRCTAIPTRKCR